MGIVSDLDDYQEFTRSTAIYPRTDQIAALQYLGLGLAGEAGEVAGKLKKVVRDDRPANGVVSVKARSALLDEIGDVLWYAARLADELNENLSFVAQRNMSKLTSRRERGTIGGSGDDR